MQEDVIFTCVELVSQDRVKNLLQREDDIVALSEKQNLQKYSKSWTPEGYKVTYQRKRNFGRLPKSIH
jgi:hypothetical protein